MFSTSEIKQLFLHEDRFVREAAMRCLGESWSRDPDLVPLCLEAMTRYGEASSWMSWPFLDRWVITEAALPLLLERLARTTDEGLIRGCNQALGQLPPTLWQANRAPIRTGRHVAEETVRRLEKRSQLAALPGEVLWKRLSDYSSQHKEQKHVGEIDHDHADDLIDALVPHAVPDADTLARLIACPFMTGEWMEIFVVQLAGRRRLKEAVPRLTEILKIDTDYYREQAVVAQARIGDPEAVRLIRDFFPAETWDCRLYSCAVLEAILDPASEAAALALLEGETDLTIRTRLCEALCQLLSASAIDAVLAQIEAGYDKPGHRLEDHVLVVADLAGRTLPRSDAWREARQVHTEEFEKRLAAWKLPAPKRPSPAPRPAPIALKPARPAKPARVGRNDPCPCGSGQKFKKCCGKH